MSNCWKDVFFRFTKEEVNKYFDEALHDPEYIEIEEKIRKERERLDKELKRCHDRVFKRIVLKHREEDKAL